MDMIVDQPIWAQVHRKHKLAILERQYLIFTELEAAAFVFGRHRITPEEALVIFREYQEAGYATEQIDLYGKSQPLILNGQRFYTFSYLNQWGCLWSAGKIPHNIERKLKRQFRKERGAG